MLMSEWLSTLNAFAKLFVKHWADIEPFTLPDDAMLVIDFEQYLLNPLSPEGEDEYTLEGSLFERNGGIELVAHCPKKIPESEDSDPEYLRRHVFYKVFAGADDREALFQAADTQKKLRKLIKPYEPKRAKPM